MNARYQMLSWNVKLRQQQFFFFFFGNLKTFHLSSETPLSPVCNLQDYNDMWVVSSGSSDMWESHNRRRFSIGKHGHGAMVSRANVMSSVTHTQQNVWSAWGPCCRLPRGSTVGQAVKVWSVSTTGWTNRPQGLLLSRCEEDCCVLFSLRKVTPIDPGGHWRRHYLRMTQWIPPSIIFIIRFSPFSFLRLSAFWNTSCIEVLGSIF